MEEPNVTKVMILDLAILEEQQVYMQTVINVPIDTSERNRILCEIIGNAQKNGMKKAQKKDMGVRRKWPRVKEKENSNTGIDGNQNV